MRRFSLFANGLLLALSLVSGTAFSADALLINGAGATFPYPLYSKWFHAYEQVDKNVKINYQAIGSGGGIRQFLAHTVDFGATDAPMTNQELAKSKVEVVHIPTVLGAVVVTYNVPVKESVKISPEALAGIYLGKIKKWNDAAIAKDNPGVKLPSTHILVTHRSDGSGTTSIFTDYLAKISPEWKKKVGAGKAVNWPVGLGGKGNDGVAGLVKQTPGAIGYVELAYAENNHLSVASLKNKAGEYVAPTLEGVTAAADGALANMPADFRVSITDPEGKASYPISGFTYLLVYKEMDGVKGEAIVRFLKWAIHDGQKFAPDLRYAPLPQALVKKVEARIDSIKTHAKKPAH